MSKHDAMHRTENELFMVLHSHTHAHRHTDLGSMQLRLYKLKNFHVSMAESCRSWTSVALETLECSGSSFPFPLFPERKKSLF
ncbi:uncharacterized protein BYT42DRAFT_586835 [Radiomyces spectabilis]|uniref:uncharacterized protein n=1 Tax=Radiomyces spectabilis TaxID=64574 RepID=UPI0022210AB3|nr:uncharacterized protein BYT42DRAFT_586835 [Radiomyces spectabilis]KAI8367596.1 hypothetical protein BYT42DRAFT_586835 [Radiomyces spectabilis]